MPTTTTVHVTGMTCGHCVHAVTQELTRIDGVGEVSVDLVPGGTSVVAITADRSLLTPELRAAIDEAGYALVDG